MLHIILCDDDKFILELSAQKITEEIKKGKLEAKIVCMTTDGKEMLTYLTRNPEESLFFIDLDFGNGQLNGIDLARQVRMITPTSKIVFVTNHQEMAMQVLSSGVEPFGFLEKSIQMERMALGYQKYIRMAIQALSNAEKEGKSICLDLGLGETISLPVAQITYVETEKTVSHGITYHTMEHSKITVRDTIEHVAIDLGEDFLRCHRSILVNRNHIIGLEDFTIRLANMEQIPCSVRMKKEVKRWIQ